MPDLTKEENEWLKLLGSSQKLTLNKRKLTQLSLFIHRLMNIADQSEVKAQAQAIMGQGFWLAASGQLSEDDIASHPRLNDQQRDDLLTMLQLRYYAQAWCTQEGIGLEALPEVEQAPVQGPQLPTPSDEKVLEMLDAVGLANAANFDEYEKGTPSRALTDSHPLPQPNQI